MIHTNKLLALLLAAILLLSLAACGGTAEPTAQDPETPIADDGAAYKGEMPIVKPGDEPVTITIGLVTNANVTDYKDNAFTKWLEEQTGLDLEFQQFADQKNAATQVALMVASGEKLPDILWCIFGINKQTGEQYGQDGYFLPLSDYFEKYGYYFHEAFERSFPDNPSILELTMRRGEGADHQPIYAFPTVTKGALADAMIQAWINREWLDKLGLEKPTTVEELYDVLIAFRDKDPNGNGKKDEIPIVGRATSDFSVTDPLNYLLNAFTFYNNSTYFSLENGKVDSPFKSDEYREGLKFVNKLFREGLITDQTWTQSATELKGITNPTGDDPYIAGVVFGDCEHMFVRDSDSVRVYEPLKPLKDATGKGGFAPTKYYRGYAIFISATCEHPVEAFKLLDFMCSPEIYLRQRWGEYGVDWVYSEGGKTGHRGGEAKIKLLNPLAYSEQNNHSWHYDNCTVVNDAYWEYEVDLTDPDNWDTIHVRKCNEIYNYTMETPSPKESFDFAIYSLAEYEERSEFASDLTSYIRDRRAAFCTNVLDPNSDADWQEYLNGLDALRYDRWIELAQIGYDRIFDK